MGEEKEKKYNHVFRYLFFPALAFSSLVTGEIGRVVFFSYFPVRICEGEYAVFCLEKFA